jgi:hypothetical protein
MCKDKNKVKDLLREAGVNETELNIAVEKVFDLANILFDKWVAHQKKSYEERKI